MLFINKKKKRGRKRKNLNSKTKIHGIFSEDNMSKKIRNDFLKFCILLANFFYDYKKGDEEFEDKFFKIKNEFKININKKKR